MRRAFTLLEVMAALLIMGIAAAAVTLSLAGPQRSAAMEDVIGELIHADRLARHTARRQGRACELAFDLTGGRLERRWLDGSDEGGYTYGLPAGVHLGELWLDNKRTGSGGVSVVCSTAGRTPTYALRIDGPGGRQRWVLFAGLSGEVSEVPDEKRLEDILSLLGPRRADAH